MVHGRQAAMKIYTPRQTTKSYADRQLDIEALKHVDKMLRKQRVFPDVHSTPRIVSGIEKAVQRYAKLFLTEIGSIKAAPQIGSTLLSRVLNGMVANEAELGFLYAIANSNALKAIRADDSETGLYGKIPPDERIVSTRLVDISIDYKTYTAKVHVFITTAAGDSFTFIIPVSAGITQ
jgi:hypothetical protein